MAGDARAYVDNLRSVGWSLEHAWLLAHRISSRLQYIGIQDAPRKRRIDGGPWAGTLYLSSVKDVSITVMQSKRDKAKRYLQVLLEQTGWDPASGTYSLKQSFPQVEISYKLLEQIRGFFCHLAMTYSILFPYLKGFHLTLASFLPDRDEHSWKVMDLETIGHLALLKDKGILEDLELFI